MSSGFAARSTPSAANSTSRTSSATSSRSTSAEEQHSFKAGKVIYNCLLVGIFPVGQQWVTRSCQRMDLRGLGSGIGGARHRARAP